jgi:Zn-dependent protease
MTSALDRLQAIDKPPRPPSPVKKRGVIVSIVAAIGLMLAKLKGAVFVLLLKGKVLLGALQLGKLGATLWTMVVVAAVYSRYYGAPFAIGLVVLTLVHELGHGAAARHIGLPVGAPIFIPFFGAMISLRQRPRSTWEDFVIGAGGPIAGSVGGATCIAISVIADSDLLFAIGYFALVLNLFNLIPVWQLDGARMCAPIRRAHAAVGAAWLLAVMIASAVLADYLNPVALFVVALGVFNVGRGWWRERRPHPATTLEQLDALRASPATLRPVSAVQERAAAFVYSGLAALLIAATQLLQTRLPDVVR